MPRATGPVPPPERTAERWLELPVTGMTCRSCEIRVGKRLREVPGVRQVKVSARLGVARARVTGAVGRDDLAAAVRAAGYDVRAEARPWLVGDRAIWRDVALAVAVVGMLWLAARELGVSQLGSRLTDGTAEGGLVVVLLVGVTAGVSTCMALVGGLVLAVSARFAETHPDASTRARLRPQAAFQAGRVVGFAALGGLIGLAGSAVTLSGPALGLAMAVVGVVMALLGLRLTGLSPRLSAVGLPTLPGRLAGLVRGPDDGARYSDARAATLGTLSFFLPCGFTQAMQLYALSTGSATRGAAVMGLFALGTLPGLLGIGGVAAAARGARGARFLRFAGVVVVAFALVNLSGAANLLGLRLPAAGEQAVGASVASPNVTLAGGVQTVRMTQSENGYAPHTTTIYAGVPVRWVITSTNSFTCAASLYAPAVGVHSLLKQGENTFSFTPGQPGRLPFSCSMGMYTGAFQVIPAPAGSSPSAF